LLLLKMPPIWERPAMLADNNNILKAKRFNFLTRMHHSLDVFIVYPSMCFNYLALHDYYCLFWLH
jgi:hypothetical protein